jgi:hypothetical protein
MKYLLKISFALIGILLSISINAQSTPPRDVLAVINANHFREQAYDNNRIRIKPMFEGNSGQPFYVPKG